jgi:hypothetical protein
VSTHIVRRKAIDRSLVGLLVKIGMTPKAKIPKISAARNMKASARFRKISAKAKRKSWYRMSSASGREA